MTTPAAPDEPPRRLEIRLRGPALVAVALGALVLVGVIGLLIGLALHDDHKGSPGTAGPPVTSPGTTTPARGSGGDTDPVALGNGVVAVPVPHGWTKQSENTSVTMGDGPLLVTVLITEHQSDAVGLLNTESETLLANRLTQANIGTPVALELHGTMTSAAYLSYTGLRTDNTGAGYEVGAFVVAVRRDGYAVTLWITATGATLDDANNAYKQSAASKAILDGTLDDFGRR